MSCDNPLMPFTFASSIILGAGGVVTLTNDETTPGNNEVYGTGPTGDKGWLPLPCLAATPVADGTYTIGAKLTGGGVNGTITTVGGLITSVTEAT